MQVDSHVRFIRNWDSDIISQWESAKNEMGVLSVYLSDIIGSIDPVTFENHHPARPIMCKTDYEGNGKMRHLRHGQQPEGVPGIHGEPTLHPFWAAGFSFARGHFTVQVPYDQYQPMGKPYSYILLYFDLKHLLQRSFFDDSHFIIFGFHCSQQSFKGKKSLWVFEALRMGTITTRRKHP